MKIATWNVARPVSAVRRDAMRTYLDEVQADLLVLTEAHDGFNPGYEYSCSSDDGRDDNHKSGHRWVTIWSSHQLSRLPTSDSIRSVAARVFPADNDPYTVFGTVLPWVGSKWKEYPSAKGVAYCEALKVQSKDWQRIAQEFPNDELFVLGDFNQDLAKKRYYGSRKNRLALEDELRNAGLVALTSGDNDPIRRDSPECACIDHICSRLDSKFAAVNTIRWPDAPIPLRPLSDHFGVAVTLTRISGIRDTLSGIRDTPIPLKADR